MLVCIGILSLKGPASTPHPFLSRVNYVPRASLRSCTTFDSKLLYEGTPKRHPNSDCRRQQIAGRLVWSQQMVPSGLQAGRGRIWVGWGTPLCIKHTPTGWDVNFISWPTSRTRGASRRRRRPRLPSKHTPTTLPRAPPPVGQALPRPPRGVPRPSSAPCLPRGGRRRPARPLRRVAPAAAPARGRSRCRVSRACGWGPG